MNYPWFDVSVGLALIGKDDVDGAEKKLTHFAEASKRFHGSVHFTTAQEYRMDLLTYRGKIAEARALAQELGAMEKPEERSSPLLDMAMTDAVLGYIENAKAELQLAQGISLGASNSTKVQMILGIIRANSNARPAAHASSRPSPTVKGLGPLESKFIVAMNDLGDLQFNEAIRGLRFISEKDDDPLYAFLLGEAYLSTGNWQRAIESMKYVQEAKGRIVTPQSELPVVAWPLSFYYTGICNEKLGHRAEAVTLYRRFLDIWREADSDLRQATNAKKRLARLSDLKSSLH